MNGWRRLWVVFSGALGIVVLLGALTAPLSREGCVKAHVASQTQPNWMSAPRIEDEPIPSGAGGSRAEANPFDQFDNVEPQPKGASPEPAQREELIALRRLAELEDKAAKVTPKAGLEPQFTSDPGRKPGTSSGPWEKYANPFDQFDEKTDTSKLAGDKGDRKYITDPELLAKLNAPTPKGESEVQPRWKSDPIVKEQAGRHYEQGEPADKSDEKPLSNVVWDDEQPNPQSRCPSGIDYAQHYGLLLGGWLGAIGFVYLVGASVAWVRRGFSQNKK